MYWGGVVTLWGFKTKLPCAAACRALRHRRVEALVAMRKSRSPQTAALQTAGAATRMAANLNLTVLGIPEGWRRKAGKNKSGWPAGNR